MSIPMLAVFVAVTNKQSKTDGRAKRVNEHARIVILRKILGL